MEYLLILLLGLIAYAVYSAYWRLYLSPISHIPGPRLAALTICYELYYDLILGGQYTFKIIELHKQYGPIIRISPQELHFSDPDFYDTIYASSASPRRTDKNPWFTQTLGIDKSIWATVEHDLHKKRRAAISPFFSKANVRRLQPVIQERFNVLLERLEGFKDTGEVLNASDMYSALTNDVVNLYSFARCNSRLEDPDFNPSSRDAAISGASSVSLLKHAHWIVDIIQALPDFVAKLVYPALASFVAEKRNSLAQVRKIITGENEKWKDKENLTIFHSILDSKLPASEKSLERLSDDAQLLVMAGTTSTASTLGLINFWLLCQPATLQKLKDELCTAIPNQDDIGSIALSTLEALPYLTGVIKEGLRLDYGLTCRLARIDPDHDIVFTDKKTLKEWVIPAGTPVASTSVLNHHNEEIFPDSRKFSPERWLDGKGRQLERYMVSFTKGSRKCLGMDLAYAELYLGISAVWRSWGSVGADGTRTSSIDDLGVMNLWETGLRDVEIESDLFVAAPQKGSKGIRVMVHS